MSKDQLQHENETGLGLNREDIDDEDILLLTLDDDRELETVILDIFPFRDKEYIALFPLEDEENILLYEYLEGEDEDDIQLLAIESDEEFDAVVEAFGDRIEEEDGWMEEDEEDLDGEEEAEEAGHAHGDHPCCGHCHHHHDHHDHHDHDEPAEEDGGSK